MKYWEPYKLFIFKKILLDKDIDKIYKANDFRFFASAEDVLNFLACLQILKYLKITDIFIDDAYIKNQIRSASAGGLSKEGAILRTNYFYLGKQTYERVLKKQEIDFGDFSRIFKLVARTWRRVDYSDYFKFKIVSINYAKLSTIINDYTDSFIELGLSHDGKNFFSFEKQFDLFRNYVEINIGNLNLNNFSVIKNDIFSTAQDKEKGNFIELLLALEKLKYITIFELGKQEHTLTPYVQIKTTPRIGDLINAVRIARATNRKIIENKKIVETSNYLNNFTNTRQSTKNYIEDTPSSVQKSNKVSQKLKGEIFKLPKDTAWEDITIEFQNKFDVKIFIENKFFRKSNNVKMGFYKGSTTEKGQNKQWDFLLKLSVEKDGKFDIKSVYDLHEKERYRQQKLKLSGQLKHCFNKKDDPFYNADEVQCYQTKFKIKPIPELRGDGEVWNTTDKGRDKDEIKNTFDEQTAQITNYKKITLPPDY